MQMTRLRRSLALVTAAALLASMTVATVAAPASAAKPRCQGFKATIVGTRKAEVIKGTAKRDIIVAKGGNDRIYGKGGNDIICAGGGNDVVFGGPGADRLWGQLGRDRLVGNAGPDFLAGQVGNDSLVGGIGVDTCYQGTGSGPVTTCERPAPPAPPAPPPPTLVVAYSDANKNHAYDAGDVMIAEIVDTNGSGRVDPGDTINMGQYPTTPYAVAPAAIRQTMEPWPVRSHPVTSEDEYPAAPDFTQVTSGARVFEFYQIGATGDRDGFAELDGASASTIIDRKDVGEDLDGVQYVIGSPSQPPEAFTLEGYSRGDDGFIDVEIYAP